MNGCHEFMFYIRIDFAWWLVCGRNVTSWTPGTRSSGRLVPSSRTTVERERERAAAAFLSDGHCFFLGGFCFMSNDSVRGRQFLIELISRRHVV